MSRTGQRQGRRREQETQRRTPPQPKDWKPSKSFTLLARQMDLNGEQYQELMRVAREMYENDWVAAAKDRLLMAMSDYGILAEACEAAGVPYEMAVRWESEDAEYAKQLSMARTAAVERTVERGLMDVGASQGGISAIAVLNAYKPTRYKERDGSQTGGNPTITLIVNAVNGAAPTPPLPPHLQPLSLPSGEEE